MPKTQTPTTIDPVAYGDKLWERMASLFSGDKPEGGKPMLAEGAKSAHSKTVAEHYASIDKSLYESIQTLNEERKNYRKYAKETLSQALEAIKARQAALNIPKTNGDGKTISATFDNKRFTIIAKDAGAEAEATAEALIDLLARARDEDLLEESLKKSRNGQIRLIADADARKYADGDTVAGGDEEGYYEGHAYASTLLWDKTGIMLGILKFAARCTRAMDRNERKDSGEIYAVMIGDLPFRRNENGDPISYLGLSPDIADLLIKGRSYHLIAEALAAKAKELDKLMREQRQEKAAAKVLRSEVLNDVNKRTEQLGKVETPEAPTAEAEAAEVTA